MNFFQTSFSRPKIVPPYKKQNSFHYSLLAAEKNISLPTVILVKQLLLWSRGGTCVVFAVSSKMFSRKKFLKCVYAPHGFTVNQYLYLHWCTTGISKESPLKIVICIYKGQTLRLMFQSQLDLANFNETWKCYSLYFWRFLEGLIKLWFWFPLNV